MKNSRFKIQYNKSASQLHKTIGEILKNKEPFKGYKIYQEYPVNKIDPQWGSGREKYDWVILDWKVVIEAHGKQHYEPVAFGGESEQEAKRKLIDRQQKDEEKKQAANKHGYAYIEIKYNFTEDEIYDEILRGFLQSEYKDNPEVEKIDWKSQYQRKKQWLEESGIAEQRRQKAREQRKKAYERKKQWAKEKGIK